MRMESKQIVILDIPICNLNRAEALDEIVRLSKGYRPALIAFANTNSLLLTDYDDHYKQIMQNVTLLLNDGIGVSLAARIQGNRFQANLNGTDFNPYILQLAAEQQWRTFLLGSKDDVVKAAAAKLKVQFPDLQIVGTHHGFFSPDDSKHIVEAIRTANTDLLMVGMGNPLQEIWLYENLTATGARLGVGVGAYFDFSAEIYQRAPLWMRQARLEWLFRFLNEPKRLWKRYFIQAPIFLWRVAWRALKR